MARSDLSLPTKPKLLVKAVNAWVRSAFGNVFYLVGVSKNVRVHELARRFCLYLLIVAHSVDLGHAELQHLNIKGKALRSNSALLRFMPW